MPGLALGFHLPSRSCLVPELPAVFSLNVADQDGAVALFLLEVPNHPDARAGG